MMMTLTAGPKCFGLLELKWRGHSLHQSDYLGCMRLVCTRDFRWWQIFKHPHAHNCIFEAHLHSALLPPQNIFLKISARVVCFRRSNPSESGKKLDRTARPVILRSLGQVIARVTPHADTSEYTATMYLSGSLVKQWCEAYLQ